MRSPRSPHSIRRACQQACRPFDGAGKPGDAPYSADPDDITAQIDLIGVPG